MVQKLYSYWVGITAQTSTALHDALKYLRDSRVIPYILVEQFDPNDPCSVSLFLARNGCPIPKWAEFDATFEQLSKEFSALSIKTESTFQEGYAPAEMRVYKGGEMAEYITGCALCSDAGEKYLADHCPEQEISPANVADFNLPSSWVLTDDDSAQYVRHISENVFELTQVVSLPNDFAVCHGQINIDDLDDDEIGETLESYGYEHGMESLTECYGDAAPRILAECTFERHFTDYLVEKEPAYYGTFEEAKTRVMEIIGIRTCFVHCAANEEHAPQDVGAWVKVETDHPDFMDKGTFPKYVKCLDADTFEVALVVEVYDDFIVCHGQIDINTLDDDEIQEILEDAGFVNGMSDLDAIYGDSALAALAAYVVARFYTEYLSEDHQAYFSSLDEAKAKVMEIIGKEAKA